MSKITKFTQEPLYQYHQRVWNHLFNEWGVIRGFLGGQLRRYRVVHGTDCYSVPEEHLDPAFNKPKAARGGVAQ